MAGSRTLLDWDDHMNFNLFAAALWLAVGVAIVVYHALNPDDQMLRVRWFDFSPGWLAILMAFYNLVRWWSSRSSDADRAFEESQESRRNRARYSTIKPTEEPPDPNFDFSKEQPPREGEAGKS